MPVYAERQAQVCCRHDDAATPDRRFRMSEEPNTTITQTATTLLMEVKSAMRVGQWKDYDKRIAVSRLFVSLAIPVINDF
jgi:hypothetical protein